uniref:hypothetical protein n=1 Tax=Klebsiella pneumoniae TaxID=573 RepID=UPI0024E0DDF2
DGTASKISDAVQMVRDRLDKIKGLMPGSPIKWGPLKGWNNTGPTGPGGRLVGLLAAGLSDTSPVDAAMNRLTSRISVAAPRVNAAQLVGTAGRAGGIGGQVGLTVQYNAPVYTHDPEDAARRLAARVRTGVALMGMP